MKWFSTTLNSPLFSVRQILGGDIWMILPAGCEGVPVLAFVFDSLWALSFVVKVFPLLLLLASSPVQFHDEACLTSRFNWLASCISRKGGGVFLLWSAFTMNARWLFCVVSSGRCVLCVREINAIFVNWIEFGVVLRVSLKSARDRSYQLDARDRWGGEVVVVARRQVWPKAGLGLVA